MNDKREAAAGVVPPLLREKNYSEPSVFTPEQLLREARRQKGIAPGAPALPALCVLDPDGDTVAYVREVYAAERDAHWACYHTDLYRFTYDGLEFGIVGGVIGASFAVLVAEELFASGCRFLMSITSAGQIVPLRNPPYFVLIERALRDEGTSHHYLPPGRYSALNPALQQILAPLEAEQVVTIHRGAAWTTDAPFRETERAIAYARSEGILAVEMEAAGLYAFAQARQKDVACFAHVTNQMGTVEGDFEKGAAQGSVAALHVVNATTRRWLEHRAAQHSFE